MLELAIIPRDLLDAARKRKEARREAMSDVCREFGISRKTGYKIYGRYKEHGLEALEHVLKKVARLFRQGHAPPL